MDRDLQLNLKPMIDVTFQLLIFFMLTINFKTKEGNLSSFLPKERGPRNEMTKPILDEFRLDMSYDKNREITRLEISSSVNFIWEDGKKVTPKMRKRLGQVADRYYKKIMAQSNEELPPVKLDATPEVPSGRVVTALDVLTKYVLDRHGASITFAGNTLSHLGK